MKKKIRIFALLLVVAMLLSAFAYAHEETDSAKIHLTGETLSEADDVQAIGNRAIFISTQNKIASVDDSQQEYVAEYVPEYQIEFAIPYQNKGVMIGSEKPTMVACSNALCKDEYELSWEGTYEYFDLTTGAVRAIRDPNTFYIAATSVGLTDRSNYTTTINGKSIPNAQYPAGGTYSGSTSTSFGTGSQCHGFGLYIYDYLFGSSGAKCSQGFEYIGNYPDTFISSNNKLSEQLRRLKQEKARLLDTDSDDLADRTRDLMDALEDGPDFLDSFDAELFDALVEKIIVDSNERLRFRLKNGLELTEQIERTRR